MHLPAPLTLTGRRPRDLYETHPDMVTALLRFAGVEIRGTVLEPCAGNGAIVRPLASRGFTVRTSDIAPGWHYQLDAAYDTVYRLSSPVSWIITNPPFSSAFPIVKLALTHATVGIAFLTRLSFLEPTRDRGRWLHEHPPDRLIVLPRYSFTGDGKTDSVTCAWCVWTHAKHPAPGVVVVPREDAPCRA
jgi:hypothetical protein